MKIFPAIDLRDGKVVRLHKGSFDDETVYGDDPVVVARSFEAAGAEWVHVVDLDAARTGEPRNRELIRRVVESVAIPVQTGGGVRDRASAEALIDIGVARIVLGTVAIELPELVAQLASQHPGCIAVGLDARSGVVATRGWLEGSGMSVIDLISRYEKAGVSAFIVTDIERDGTLGGPDVEGLGTLATRTAVEVIASGGVGSLDDLRSLTKTGVGGAIVGKALYEGRFELSEAVAVGRGEA